MKALETVSMEKCVRRQTDLKPRLAWRICFLPRLFLLGLVLSAMVALIPSRPAAVRAVTCTTNPVVTNNGDSGAGSLRQAVLDACDGSTITIAGSVTSPITLTTGELAIDKNLTITGPGASALTISGNNAGQATAPAPAGVVGSFNTCLVDSSGNQLQWSSATGAYTFTRSSDGFMLSGTGTVGLVNGIRTLTDFKSDRRLSAGFNTGQLTGSATIYLQVAQGVWQSFRIVDTNPSATCTPPPTLGLTGIFSIQNADFFALTIGYTSTGGTSAVLARFRSDGLLVSSTPVATSGSISVEGVNGVACTGVALCHGDVLILTVTGPGGSASLTFTVS